MGNRMKSMPVPGLALAAAIAMSGCADTSKPQTRVAKAEPTKIDYRSDFDATYPDAFSARKSPARILRDAAQANPAKMAKIGTLTIWIPVGLCARRDDCGIKRKQIATEALRREAAARGGDFVLVIADNQGSLTRPERVPPDENGSKSYDLKIFSRGDVYRAGDITLLRRVVMQKADDALRRAEAAEARAKAAYERAAAARRELDAMQDSAPPGQGTADK